MRLYGLILVLVCLAFTRAQSQTLTATLENNGYAAAKKLVKTNDSLLPALLYLTQKYFNASASVGSQIDQVSDQDNWITNRSNFTYKTRKHTLVIGAQKVQRFGKQDQQLEGEHYWKLSDAFYVNSMAGLSKGNLLPESKLGGQFNLTKIRKTEIGVGARWYNFTNEQVIFTTFSLTYYPKNSYFNYQTFWVKSPTRTDFVHLFRARRYLNNSRGYFMAEYIVGQNPDQLLTSISTTQNQRIGLGINYRLSPRFSSTIMLSRERFAVNEQLTRQITSVNCTFTYHFRIAKH